MLRSRTIKTLGCLLGALTIGTFALLALETSPARPAALLALSARQDASAGLNRWIHQTHLPVHTDKWRYIVIHDSVCDLSTDAAQGCHFLVRPDPGDETNCLTMTERWRRQGDGDHIRLPGYDLNKSSIGICLQGDFSAQPPTADQMKDLLDLVRALQNRFGIAPEHVYFHGDLTGSPCPGETFPVSRFRSQLQPGWK